jgi:hypothetical protein
MATMLAKSLSVLLAAAALVGAVIYAQTKAEKGTKVSPVFETSKSGTPTPIEDSEKQVKSKKPAVKKPNETDEIKQEKTTNETQQAAPIKKKKKKVMPTSKSYIPD